MNRRTFVGACAAAICLFVGSRKDEEKDEEYEIGFNGEKHFTVYKSTGGNLSVYHRAEKMRLKRIDPAGWREFRGKSSIITLRSSGDSVEVQHYAVWTVLPTQQSSGQKGPITLNGVPIQWIPPWTSVAAGLL